jgi:hypothetical protein
MWHGGKLLCVGLSIWIVLDMGWIQLFLHSCNDRVSVKDNGERVVSHLEGSVKVIMISGVLGAHIELTESRIINRQEAVLIPLINVSLACASGRFRSWVHHHFNVQFLNVLIGQELESADGIAT